MEEVEAGIASNQRCSFSIRTRGTLRITMSAAISRRRPSATPSVRSIYSMRLNFRKWSENLEIMFRVFPLLTVCATMPLPSKSVLTILPETPLFHLLRAPRPDHRGRARLPVRRASARHDFAFYLYLPLALSRTRRLGFVRSIPRFPPPFFPFPTLSKSPVPSADTRSQIVLSVYDQSLWAL